MCSRNPAGEITLLLQLDDLVHAHERVRDAGHVVSDKAHQHVGALGQVVGHLDGAPGETTSLPPDGPAAKNGGGAVECELKNAWICLSVVPGLTGRICMKWIVSATLWNRYVP